MCRSLTELMASIQKWKAGKALWVVEPSRAIYVNLRDNKGPNMLQTPQKKVEVGELVGLVWYIHFHIFCRFLWTWIVKWYDTSRALHFNDLVFHPLKAAVYSISLTFSWMRCERCNYVLPIQFPLGLKHREQKMHQLRQGIGRWYSEIDQNLAILGP